MRLALDLGTTTGYAMRDGTQIISGSKSFAVGKYEGGGMRFLRFRRWLNEIKPTEVIYEAVRRHIGTDAAHAYGGFMGTLTAWCEENGVPYSGVPVQTIKKFATGKGNAGKDAMILAAKAVGVEAKDDNEADALHLLLYAEAVDV